MRPYPDELLAIMRASLRNVVTPTVSDEWPRYVAKSLERLFEHLERRWKHELRFLADDTEEMRELFAKLGPELAGGTSAHPAVAPVLEDIDGLLAKPSLASRAVEMTALNQENEAYRAVLERLIEALDAVEGEPRSDVRPAIRSYLAHQLDRDVVLAEPTFMHFAGPPAQAS